MFTRAGLLLPIVLCLSACLSHFPSPCFFSPLLSPPSSHNPSFISLSGRKGPRVSGLQPRHLLRAAFHQRTLAEASEPPRETESSCLLYRMTLGRNVMSWAREDQCDDGGKECCPTVDRVVGPQHRRLGSGGAPHLLRAVNFSKPAFPLCKLGITTVPCPMGCCDD